MQSPPKTALRLSLWPALAVLLSTAMMAAPHSSRASQDQPASNMEILRDKLRADKKLLIAENLGLTEAQSMNFWPVYEEYQKELEGINNRLRQVIQSYATEYNANTLTDAKARSLMEEALAIEEAEVALKKKYLAKLDGVIPAMNAVRYLQMENKIRALIRFDMAASIPLVE